MLDETANIFPSMVPQMRDRISVYAIQVEGKRVVVFEVRPKMNDPMVYQEQPIITMAFRTEDEGLVLSDDEEEIDDFLYVKETNRKTTDDFIPYI